MLWGEHKSLRYFLKYNGQQRQNSAFIFLLVCLVVPYSLFSNIRLLPGSHAGSRVRGILTKTFSKPLLSTYFTSLTTWMEDFLAISGVRSWGNKENSVSGHLWAKMSTEPGSLLYINWRLTGVLGRCSWCLCSQSPARFAHAPQRSPRSPSSISSRRARHTHTAARVREGENTGAFTSGITAERLITEK